MRFHYSFLVAAAITIISSAAWADGIKMLPPSDFDGKVCAGTKVGVLQWDGANPIQCIPSFIGDKDGNVGIGTTTPQAKLDVRGQSILGNGIKIFALPDGHGGARNGGGYGMVLMSDYSWQSYNQGFGSPGTKAWGIGAVPGDSIFPNGRNQLQFVFTDGSGVGTGMAIQPTGDVGINNFNPAARLDVNGEARVGSSGALCSSTNEGAIRYDSATKTFKGCDGTQWASLGKGTLKTQQVACIGRYEGHDNDYGCVATCPSGTQVTGGGFQWGAVISEWGRNLWQEGNGYHCLVNVNKCSSGAPSCGAGCYATCASIE